MIPVAAQWITPDPTFPVGTGPDAAVMAISIQPDGRILAGGYFSNVNSVLQPMIARFHTDGSLDGSFAPALGIDQTHNFTVPEVRSLSEGRVFITGSFTNIGGLPRPGIAILNEDGSPYSLFTPPLSSTPSGWINGTPSPDGSVWITGLFTNIGGFPRNRLARLLADGSVDPSFQSSFSRTNGVSIIAIQADGKAIITSATYGTVRSERLVRLNVDGTEDPAFKSALGTTSHVSRAILQMDGRMIAVENPLNVSGPPG